jgi:ferredoxin-type protein NapF
MVDQNRRNFFRVKKVVASDMIRLPWSLDEQHFIENCTQCGNCLSACEEQIIIKGDGGFPTIDFTKGECTFCQKCVESCQLPLFAENLAEQPWRLVKNESSTANLAIEIKDNCLAMNQVFCRSCQDSCEVEAISFQYHNSSIPQPIINSNDCNGCGACVSVCPQTSINISPLKSVIMNDKSLV